MTKQEITNVFEANYGPDHYKNGPYSSLKIEFQGYKIKIQSRGHYDKARYSYHIYKKGFTIASKDIYGHKAMVFSIVADILIKAVEAEVESLLLLDDGISQSSSFSEPNDNT